MKNVKRKIVAISLATLMAGSVFAADITKEFAIEQALAAHPGKVEKAYQETKKGVLVWEVKIKGEDGHMWKNYYRVDNGELFMEKKNDEIVKEDGKST